MISLKLYGLRLLATREVLMIPVVSKMFRYKFQVQLNQEP